MGLCDRTYWWINCEVAGCNAGDRLDDSDSPEEAKQHARDRGFKRTADGLWYCPDHQEKTE